MRMLIAVACAAALSASVSAQSNSAQAAPGPVAAKGCLTQGPAPNQFTLTSSEEPTAGAVAGTSGTTPAKTTVKTVTYTLTPAADVDLKSHVGHTVEVHGTESAPLAEASASATTPSTTAAGDVPGGAKAKVQTSAKADIVIKQLEVTSVRMVSDTCTVSK
jgi:hypothetical protein